MSVRAVCKFRLRGRPFSGTMDRAVNSKAAKVQKLKNRPNLANFAVLFFLLNLYLKPKEPVMNTNFFLLFLLLLKF